MLYRWFLFLSLVRWTLANEKPWAAANDQNGLRGHNRELKGCPRSFPNSGDGCKSEGQFCEYDFVYFPTIERDPDTGGAICKLPYTDCAPLAGCHCEDVGDGTGRLGWICFSAGLEPCANDTNDIFDETPELAFKLCNPKRKKFPSK